MKKSELLQLTSLTMILVAMLLAQTSSALSLTEYLEQAKQQSSSYKSYEEQSQASGLKGREADLYFTPKLFGDVRSGHDGKEQFASAITYDRLRTQSYSLGVAQEFEFGLTTKLSYAASKIEVEGALLPAGVSNSFWTASPLIELSFPLLGNSFGSTTQATRDLISNQNQAEYYAALFQSDAFLTEAETAYWRLSAAKEIVLVQTRAAKQAQSILDYVSRKARMNLGENADVLQAKALVAATTYQLQGALNSEKAARRTFNTYINRSAEQPAEDLEVLNYAKLDSVQVPAERLGDRRDILAAQSQAQLAKANAALTRERNRPQLDLYGSYALNGQDAEFAEAMKNAGRTEQDTALIGLRLNMPLYFSASSDVRAGVLKAERAADLQFQHKRFLQEQDWRNLTQQLEEAKQNLRLATDLMAAQKAKLENERARLRQGRTTTYQILLFEQDFSQAEVARVQAAGHILSLQAQFKLFNQNESKIPFEGMR